MLTGVQYVTIAGILKMQMLYVDSWDSCKCQSLRKDNFLAWRMERLVVS